MQNYFKAFLLFFSLFFLSISYIHKEVCLDTTIPCNDFNTRSLSCFFFKVAIGILVTDWLKISQQCLSFPAISQIHKSVKTPQVFAVFFLYSLLKQIQTNAENGTKHGEQCDDFFRGYVKHQFSKNSWCW